MPEGLSPSEVGKEIAEHRKKAAEKAEEQANGSATEAKGHDRLITIVEAVLLAVVAVLAAYSGFAAAKWGTESSLQLAKASAARTESNRADLESFGRSHNLSSDQVDGAIRDGLRRAVQDAQRAGQIGGTTAYLLNTAISTLPIDAIFSALRSSSLSW